MYCKRCGNELSGSGRFCGRCGLAVSVTQEYAAAEHAAPLGDYGTPVANGPQGVGAPQGEPPKRKKRRTGIIAGLSAIAAAAAVIALAVFVVLPKLGSGAASDDAPGGNSDDEVVQISDDLYYTEPSDEHVVTDAETGIEYVDNELVVYAAQGAGEDDVLAAFSEYGAEVIGHSEASNSYQLELDGTFTFGELEQIGNDARDSSGGTIEDISINLYSEYTLDAETNDPAWSEGADRTWGLDAIDAPEAWDLVTADSSVCVGVLDNQVYVDHEDLNSAVAEVQPSGGEYFSLDGEGTLQHGTHVAGIIGAESNDDGSVGVAYGCSIYGYSVFRVKNSTRSAPKGFSYSINSGIDYLVGSQERNGNSRCSVINMSFGLTDSVDASNGDLTAQVSVEAYSEHLEKQLNALIRMGHDDFVICKSAGNRAKDGDKAGWNFCALIDDEEVRARVIIVGALQQDDEEASSVVAWYSTPGEDVDVFAPGSNIYSTWFDASEGTYSSIESTYEAIDGTSMAAPMVSGVAALVIAANPDLKGDEIKDIIVSTAQGSYTDSEGVSRGCVNAYAAVTRAQDGNELSNYLGKTFPCVKMVFPTVEEALINLWDGYLINSSDSYGGYENEEFSFASRSESQTNVDTICLIGESEYTLAGVSYGQDGEDARSLLEASGWELVYSESTADKHLLNAEWYTKDDQTLYVCFGKEDLNGGAVTRVSLFDGIVPAIEESPSSSDNTPNALYAQKVRELLAESGNPDISKEHPYVTPDVLGGLCFADLLDFDGDGSDELLVAYEPHPETGNAEYGSHTPLYTVEVWKAQGSDLEMLIQTDYGRGTHFTDGGMQSLSVGRYDGRMCILSGQSDSFADCKVWTTDSQGDAVCHTLECEDAAEPSCYVDGSEVSSEEFWNDLFSNAAGSEFNYPLTGTEYMGSGYWSSGNTALDVLFSTLSELGISDVPDPRD